MSSEYSAATLLPDGFYLTLQQLLEQQPTGISEYDLLQQLRAQGYFEFMGPAPALPQDIFRAHFLLFHALYQLRDRLNASKQHYLQIGPLEIKLLAYQCAQAALTQPDELAAYYQDLSNLEAMTETEVNELIASFWNRFSRHENRADALAELGLCDPVDDETIKQTYRRLAMTHHPDRGGDNEQLQLINAAVNLLLGKTR